MFHQFQIKHSWIKSVLMNLDENKSTGDDIVSPTVKESCTLPLCGPLTGLFQQIIHQGVFLAT